MTCLNPKKAWQRNYSSLTEPAASYYRHKKLTFKEPKNKENYIEYTIPCGNCLGCRLDHSNEWASRIYNEIKQHKDNCFITLTYNNENLPKNETGKMTLNKHDVQCWIKRLRKEIKKKILYFGAGEYGGKTQRPHYHFIIMGWKPVDAKEIFVSKTQNAMFESKTLNKTWGKGWVTVQEANYNTACYVARYVTKKAGIQPDKRIAKDEIQIIEKTDERTGNKYEDIKQSYEIKKDDWLGRQKEFVVMSKKPAIGLTTWQTEKEKIKRNNGLYVIKDSELKLKPIPRYFKKLWQKENSEEFYSNRLKTINKALENKEKILQKIFEGKTLEGWEQTKKEQILMKTTKKNLEEKAKYLKRNQI